MFKFRLEISNCACLNLHNYCTPFTESQNVNLHCVSFYTFLLHSIICCVKCQYKHGGHKLTITNTNNQLVLHENWLNNITFSTSITQLANVGHLHKRFLILINDVFDGNMLNFELPICFQRIKSQFPIWNLDIIVGNVFTNNQLTELLNVRLD